MQGRNEPFAGEYLFMQSKNGGQSGQESMSRLEEAKAARVTFQCAHATCELNMVPSP